MITLTPVGNWEENIQVGFYVRWEETGLFIHLDASAIDDDYQEYRMKFPSSDYSKIKVIKIGVGYDPWVDTTVASYAPRKNARRIWGELERDVWEALKEEALDDPVFPHNIISQVFKDETLKVEE